MKYLFLWMAALVLLAGCNTPKTVSAPPSDAPTTETEPETEERNLDTLTISASPLAPQEAPMEATEDIPDTLPRYNASHTRVNDLLHTKLDLRFDWENEQVLGKATLKLKPYFYPTDSVTLDAKNFEFHQVAFAGKDAPLQYEYDGQQIVIDLGREYTRDEEYEIFIDYTASPNETG